MKDTEIQQYRWVAPQMSSKTCHTDGLYVIIRFKDQFYFGYCYDNYWYSWCLSLNENMKY